MLKGTVGDRSRPSLAITLKPVDGECLDSWLHNCAHLADVTVGDLLHYLELPREWAKENLSRGVISSVGYSAGDTETLLKRLGETFEMPIARLRHMLVHASGRHLRVWSALRVCPDCAADDAREGLLPRIQRTWLLRTCSHCDTHHCRLEAFPGPNERTGNNLSGRRQSGTSAVVTVWSSQECDFVAQVRQGLLLGWEPRESAYGIALFGLYRERTRLRHARRQPTYQWSESSRKVLSLLRSQEIIWCVRTDPSDQSQRADPLLSTEQLLQIAQCRAASRLVVYENGREEPLSLEAAAKAFIAPRQLDLDDLRRRLEAAHQIACRVVMDQERRERLRAEIAQAQGALGRNCAVEALKLRQQARGYLDAAGLHELDPLFACDMEHIRQQLG